MRLLLDTHLWIFINQQPSKLSSATRRLLLDPANERLLSLASCWEIAIKFATGKLPLPTPPKDYIPSRLSTTATTLLPISLEHVLEVAALPRHHGDPFDRLLVAQAIVEGIPIVTADPHLAQYPVNIIPA